MKCTGKRPCPVTVPPLPPPVTPSSTPCSCQTQQEQVIKISLSLEGIGYIARLISIVATIIATVIMAIAKQTIGSKYDINTKVKFSIISALNYFLAANFIVLIYSIIALLIYILKESKPLRLKLWIAIVDIVAVSMLLTGNGAGSAVSAELENIDDGFVKSVCSFYCKFCSLINASIAMSMIAVPPYVALIVLSVVTAYKAIREDHVCGCS